MSSKQTYEITAHHEARRKRNRPGEALSSFMYDRKTLPVHSWIECVVLGLQPFGFVENDTFRRHFKHNSIAHRNLVLYLSKLVQDVDSKIKDSLLKQIEIMFDNWTCTSTHNVALLQPTGEQCSKLWASASFIFSIGERRLAEPGRTRGHSIVFSVALWEREDKHRRACHR